MNEAQKLLSTRRRKIPLVEKFLQELSMWFFVFTIIIVSQFSYILFIHLLIHRPLFPLTYLLWMYYDRHTPHQRGRKFQKFIWIRNKIFKKVREYFPMRLIKTADLPADKSYLFCIYPHGVICLGHLVNFIVEVDTFENLFPGLTSYSTTVGLNFYLPVFRDLLLTNGVCSSSPRSIEAILSKPGSVCSLTLGGSAELLLQGSDKVYKIFVEKRKGFIKIAMKTGAKIVPVFSFGENQIYRQVHLQWKLFKLIKWWSYKILGIVPILFKGRLLLNGPTLFMPLPLRTPVFTVVGKPIELPLNENPPDSLVEEYHELFKKELMTLFNENKGLYDLAGEEAQLQFE